MDLDARCHVMMRAMYGTHGSVSDIHTQCVLPFARAVMTPAGSFTWAGAEARMAAFHPESLPSVVRSLRTTDGERSPSCLTVCAFAPPEWSL